MIDCASLASLRNALSPFPAIACVVVLENTLRIGCQHGATQYAGGRQSGRTEGLAAYGSRNLEVLNLEIEVPRAPHSLSTFDIPCSIFDIRIFDTTAFSAVSD